MSEEKKKSDSLDWLSSMGCRERKPKQKTAVLKHSKDKSTVRLNNSRGNVRGS